MVVNSAFSVRCIKVIALQHEAASADYITRIIPSERLSATVRPHSFLLTAVFSTSKCPLIDFIFLFCFCCFTDVNLTV